MNFSYASFFEQNRREDAEAYETMASYPMWFLLLFVELDQEQFGFLILVDLFDAEQCIHATKNSVYVLFLGRNILEIEEIYSSFQHQQLHIQSNTYFKTNLFEVTACI